MSIINTQAIRDYLIQLTNWIKGTDSTSSPKVTVSGSVNVNNFPTTQDVKITSSTATINTADTRLPSSLGASGGVKTEIVNTPTVNVSGIVTVGTHAVTSSQLPSALTASGNLKVALAENAVAISVTDARLPATLDADGGLKVHVQNPSDMSGIAQKTQLPTALQNGALKVAVTESVQPIGKTEEEVKRQTLVANTVATFSFSSTCDEFEIMNLGDADIYIDVATNPTIDGTNSILIPAGFGFTLKVKTDDIRAISIGTSKVQIVGVR